MGERLGALLGGEEAGGSVASTKLPSAWEAAAPAGGRGPVTIGEADRAAIARVLCEGSAARARCGKCPSYTEFAGEAGDLRVVSLHPGHFSGPGRIEAVVALEGCESGASSSFTFGGRALVRRAPEGWQRVHYAAGALGKCTAILSGAGRSRLVCHVDGGHMGVYPETFFLLGFDADARDGTVVEERDPFLELVHHQPAEPPTDFQVVRHTLRGKARYEAGDDKALGFEATVRVRVPPWEARLRYRLEGSAFVIEPGSRAAHDRLRPLARE
jgi:hypothetical protein